MGPTEPDGAMRQLALILSTGLALSASLRAVAPAASGPPQRGGYHEDSRCGYKIKPPKDWEPVPLKLDESWHVAKFLSDRVYFWTSDDDGWTWEHRPQMTVIAFVQRTEEEEPAAESDEPQEGVEVVTIVNPYEDYKDYLKRTYSGGGYHVAAEEEGMVAKVRTTELEIRVERGSRNGPKRIVTWIYHLESLDLAVEFEVLETEWDKLEKVVLGTLKSFKPIPRTGEGLPDNEGLSARLMILSEMDELSPAERKEQRIQLEQSLHDKARAGMLEEWTAEEMGRFLVLNHCDEKVAERMVERADAVLSFLDDHFAYVGRNEYVRRPILRICKDWEEESSYRKGGAGWWSLNDLEVVTHDDQMGAAGSWEGEWINRRVVDLWFSDRDRDLYWAFPSWLRQGLQNSFATALPKRRKLEFREDDWDRDVLRQMVRDGSATPPRELILMGREQFFGSGSSFWNRQREAGALVRFFLSGQAAKSSKTKDVLDDYIMNLKLLVDRIDAEKEDAPDRKPKTEAEEDEYFRKRQEAWKEKERMVLDDVFDRTFRAWTDKDWEAFDKVYFKSIK